MISKLYHVTRECMSILTKISDKHALYFKWLANQSYLNIILSLICYNSANIAGIIIEEASITRREGLILRAQVHRKNHEVPTISHTNAGRCRSYAGHFLLQRHHIDGHFTRHLILAGLQSSGSWIGGWSALESAGVTIRLAN
jgi:hypothetical protein